MYTFKTARDYVYMYIVPIQILLTNNLNLHCLKDIANYYHTHIVWQGDSHIVTVVHDQMHDCHMQSYNNSAVVYWR